MVKPRVRNRRGGSTLGCIFSLLVFAAVLYYGVNIGSVYFRYYQLMDTMRTNARLAPSLNDATIRRRLLARVEELGLPDEAQKFTIKRSGRPRTITISTEYSESVDLPLFKHTFVFRPEAVEGL
ncbi:MAG: hypothetical protein AB7Q69_07910 [Gemmatimonadales bacterium]